MSERRKIVKKHVEPKLIKRLRIFAIIITILIGIGIYKIFLGEIRILLAGIALLAGIVIGLIAGRMFKIYLHPETGKVVSRLDKIGAIFLLLYIGVEIGKKWIFGNWLHGAELSAFSLIFLAGLLLGRLLSMMKSIKTLLQQKKHDF